MQYSWFCLDSDQFEKSFFAIIFRCMACLIDFHYVSLHCFLSLQFYFIYHNNKNMSSYIHCSNTLWKTLQNGPIPNVINFLLTSINKIYSPHMSTSVLDIFYTWHFSSTYIFVSKIAVSAQCLFRKSGARASCINLLYSYYSFSAFVISGQKRPYFSFT